MMKTNKKAKWLMSFSMIIFGTLGLFTRNIAVSSGELALYRAILALVLILGYFVVAGKKINLKKLGTKDLVLLVASGAAMGTNWILLFEAYKYTSISLATLSYYFAPVIVTVVCPFLFREVMTKRQILCFVMSTIGLAFIIGFEGEGGSGSVVGILLGLGAASFYAAVIILNKFIKNVEGIHRTVFQFLAAAIVLFPYVLSQGEMSLDTLDGKGWMCLLVVGLVHTGLTYCMYFSAIKELRGQQVAILSYLDPLVAVLLSVIALGERMNFMQFLGGIFILGFTFLNEYTENVDK